MPERPAVSPYNAGRAGEVAGSPSMAYSRRTSSREEEPMAEQHEPDENGEVEVTELDQDRDDASAGHINQNCPCGN